jgi:hypothetical protein
MSIFDLIKTPTFYAWLKGNSIVKKQISGDPDRIMFLSLLTSGTAVMSLLEDFTPRVSAEYV